MKDKLDFRKIGSPKKRKQSQETDSERQLRLEKDAKTCTKSFTDSI